MTEQIEVQAQPVPVVAADKAVDLGTLNVFDPDAVGPAEIARIRQMVEFRDQLLKVAISQTSASQWTIFADDKAERQTVRPDGYAASAIFSFWGAYWRSPTKPGELFDSEETNEKDGTKVIWVKSALCRRDKVVQVFIGRRPVRGFMKTDHDTKLAAFQNLLSRAAAMVFGLGGLTVDDYKARFGIDMAGAKRSEFKTHKDETDPSSATIPFGDEKGKKVAEASDGAVAYHLKRCAEDIERAKQDPAKASGKDRESIERARKWSRRTEALYAALLAESQKRKAAKPETATTPPAEGAATATEPSELDKLLAQIREVAFAAGIPAAKIDARLKSIQNVEQARAALDAASKLAPQNGATK